MNEENTVGRPTKYNQAIVDKAWHYLDHYSEYGNIIPSIVGLAQVLGLNRETLRLWSKDENKEAFFGILERIMCEQECELINKGLDGTFNSTITKLLLGKHGYHDRPQQADHQIQVIVSRGGVALKVGNDSLAIENKSESLDISST